MTPAELVAAALRARGEASFRVRGGSMWPFLGDGAAVRVRPLAAAPAVGDVVLRATSDGRLLCHRVVARAPGRVDTRGDARDASDGWIAERHLLGIVVSADGATTRRFIAWAAAPALRIARRLYRATRSV